mgnify:CR=1 FL=1
MTGGTRSPTRSRSIMSCDRFTTVSGCWPEPDVTNHRSTLERANHRPTRTYDSPPRQPGRRTALPSALPHPVPTSAALPSGPRLSRACRPPQRASRNGVLRGRRRWRNPPAGADPPRCRMDPQALACGSGPTAPMGTGRPNARVATTTPDGILDRRPLHVAGQRSRPLALMSSPVPHRGARPGATAVRRRPCGSRTRG